MSKKTVRQWLESIEDPELKKRALENMANHCFHKRNADEKQVADLRRAMGCAFDFTKTPEGNSFWLAIINDTRPRKCQFEHFKHLIPNK